LASPRAEIRSLFPNLAQVTSFKVTSDQADIYNCVSWAISETHRWWWPVTKGKKYGYWPPGLSQALTIDNFIAALATVGFEPCQNFDVEAGFEKVVLYMHRSGAPTHLARQLPNGRWTSKLGELWDIEHKTLGGLEGSLYGRPIKAFRRPQPLLQQGTRK